MFVQYYKTIKNKYRLLNMCVIITHILCLYIKFRMLRDEKVIKHNFLIWLFNANNTYQICMSDSITP